MPSLPFWLRTATSPGHRVSDSGNFRFLELGYFSIRLFGNTHGFEEERSLFAYQTWAKLTSCNMRECCLFCFGRSDDNFMKQVKGILHTLHCIFFFFNTDSRSVLIPSMTPIPPGLLINFLSRFSGVSLHSERKFQGREWNSAQITVVLIVHLL